MNLLNHIELFIIHLKHNQLWMDILMYITIAFFTIQLLYYFLFFLPVIYKRRKSATADEKPVSIIICAKNEEENLREHLPEILNQDYKEFEVIVVNDGSMDNTEELLGQLKEKHSRLKFTNITEDVKFSHGKKLALTVGIKAAKYDYLLLTDADCYPKSNQWIRSMQRNFLSEKQIILGYGAYEKQKGLLNRLIRFETLFIAMQYFGFANLGIPYMGVGRNLAYKKSLFFENKGFASHAQILSGDDDLFVNEVATKKNCTFDFSLDAHTISKPKSNWEDWSKQKRRHLSTGRHYPFFHKTLLFLEPFSRILFYALSVILLIFSNHVELLTGLLVFKVILLLIAIKLVMKRLDEKGFWLLSIIFDIILPFINFYFIFSNYLSRRNNKWN